MDYLLLRWNKHTPLWHGLPPLPCGMDYLLLRWPCHKEEQVIHVTRVYVCSILRGGNPCHKEEEVIHATIIVRCNATAIFYYNPVRMIVLDGKSIHPCGMDYLLLRWKKHTPLWHGLPSLKMEQAYTLVAWITFS
jgi:hypothetical protein